MLKTITLINWSLFFIDLLDTYSFVIFLLLVLSVFMLLFFGSHFRQQKQSTCQNIKKQNNALIISNLKQIYFSS